MITPEPSPEPAAVWTAIATTDAVRDGLPVGLGRRAACGDDGRPRLGGGRRRGRRASEGPVVGEAPGHPGGQGAGEQRSPGGGGHERGPRGAGPLRRGRSGNGW